MSGVGYIMSGMLVCWLYGNYLWRWNVEIGFGFLGNKLYWVLLELFIGRGECSMVGGVGRIVIFVGGEFRFLLLVVVSENFLMEYWMEKLLFGKYVLLVFYIYMIVVVMIIVVIVVVIVIVYFCVVWYVSLCYCDILFYVLFI